MTVSSPLLVTKTKHNVAKDPNVSSKKNSYYFRLWYRLSDKLLTRHALALGMHYVLPAVATAQTFLYTRNFSARFVIFKFGPGISQQIHQ